MASSSSIPSPALGLGLGGLVPFVVCALIIANPEIAGNLIAEAWSGQHALQSWCLMALSTYGAVILSFLGGIRWGHILHDQDQLNRWLPLSLSVMPSLVAWLALLLPTKWMLTVLIVGFLIQYALDANATNNAKLPLWFGKLRLILTCGAVCSLLLGLVAILR